MNGRTEKEDGIEVRVNEGKSEWWILGSRRWQDKRRKGFKPRARDKLVCPAGGLGFLEPAHRQELRMGTFARESRLPVRH